MEKTITAKLNYLRITPRKTRFVADLIRGLSVNEAEARLTIGVRRPGDVLLKLLKSAVANAITNSKLDPGTLYIKEIRVDQAPKLVRYWPRARGSMGKIEKKASHITLVLGVSDKIKKTKFTIIPKPKKSKTAPEEKNHEHKSKEKTQKGDENREKLEKKEKMNAPKPKTGGGFFRKVFSRKSI